MANTVKSGKEILNEFFAGIDNIENVDPAITSMIKQLYDDNKLTEANVKNELQRLRTENERYNQ